MFFEAHYKKNGSNNILYSLYEQFIMNLKKTYTKMIVTTFILQKRTGTYE